MSSIPFQEKPETPCWNKGGVRSIYLEKSLKEQILAPDSIN